MSAATIGWSDALRAQLVLLVRVGRVRVLLTIAALAVLFSSYMIWRTPSEDFRILSFVLMEMQVLLVVIAAGWGIATWWHEPPARRDPMLALPVDLTQHELARIAAGALWLLVAFALTLAASVIVQASFGQMPVIRGVAPAAWIALFSGPLLAYLITVTASTGTRRSLELVLAGFVALSLAYGIVSGLAFERGGAGAVDRLSRYSLFMALGGVGTETVRTASYAPDGSTVQEQFRVVYGSYVDPHWYDASVLWWTLAGFALAFVLWRRRRA
ncbi:MAG TPA: hypothetical protein VFZ24_16935 [Longimicrobiales bacterium]